MADVLRVFWPRKLELPELPLQADVLLIGRRDHRMKQHEEVVVVAAAAAAPAAAAAAEVAVAGRGLAVVGTLLRSAPAAHNLQYAHCDNDRDLRFFLYPTAVPAHSMLPVPLPPTPAPIPPPQLHTRAAAARRQQKKQALQQGQRQVQLVLYWPSVSPHLGPASPAPANIGELQRQQRQRQRLCQIGGQLVSHLAGALLAALLLAQWHVLGGAAARGGSQLAEFATRQLAWFTTAQPAGEQVRRLIHQDGCMPVSRG